MKMKIENGLVIRTVPQVAIRGRGGMVGCETDPFPPFQRRGGCAMNKKTPFLSGADGVVSDFQQKIRIAARAYKEATRPFTNHPGAARHPSLKTEGNAAVSEPTHSLPFKQRRMDLSSISKFLPQAISGNTLINSQFSSEVSMHSHLL